VQETTGAVLTEKYFYVLEWKEVAIAAPRLRPLFKDKQIVEGSDGCGLFVDNFFF
jgi:hypothetical protein